MEEKSMKRFGKKSIQRPAALERKINISSGFLLIGGRKVKRELPFYSKEEPSHRLAARLCKEEDRLGSGSLVPGQGRRVPTY